MTRDELIFVRIKQLLVDNEWLLVELQAARKEAVSLGKEKNPFPKAVKALRGKSDTLFSQVVRNTKTARVVVNKLVECFIARADKQELIAGELASEADGLYEELLNTQEKT
jgi:hypothetical protein